MPAAHGASSECCNTQSSYQVILYTYGVLRFIILLAARGRVSQAVAEPSLQVSRLLAKALQVATRWRGTLQIHGVLHLHLCSSAVSLSRELVAPAIPSRLGSRSPACPVLPRRLLLLTAVGFGLGFVQSVYLDVDVDLLAQGSESGGFLRTRGAAATGGRGLARREMSNFDP